MSDYMFMLESHLSSEQSRVVADVQAVAVHANVNVFLTGGAMRDLNTLLGFGQCWTLVQATTINDSGWIAGFGKPASDPYNTHGFLLKPLTSMGPPDTSAVIIVQKPVLGQKWIVGEQDSVMWTNTGVQNVDIKYTTDHGYTIHTLALGIPADNGKYVFTVPKELSTHCTAYVSSSTDARVAGASETFKIKGYEWTRFTPDGNYEAFRPGVHGWSFANDSSTMWPSSGYVSYDHEVDSVTGMAYPQWFVQEPINAKPGDFPSWPLFVQTFGRNGCYFDSAGYGSCDLLVLKWLSDAAKGAVFPCGNGGIKRGVGRNHDNDRV